MNTAEKLEPTVTIDISGYDVATEEIRKEAARLLSEKIVDAVVGYQSGRRLGSAVPVIITEPASAEKLIFSPACVNNLSLYLTKAKKEIRGKGKLAVVAKGCDLRALAGLMGESQFKREDVVIIGVSCAGVHSAGIRPSEPLSGDTIANKCRECTVHIPEGADLIVGKLPQLPDLSPKEKELLDKLDAMSPAERWEFWKEQFTRCIRCLACRQVCPFCYCEQCLCDRGRPQSVDTSPRPAGNMGWHIVRAMHLAGRCAGCAECERVCPMDIPLNLLNRKMAQELKELYGHEAGLQAKEKGPLTSYDEKDDQSFIK
jgi:ferredoxin